MKDKKRSLELLSFRTVTLLIGLLCCIAVFSASAKTDMDNAKNISPISSNMSVISA